MVRVRCMRPQSVTAGRRPQGVAQTRESSRTSASEHRSVGTAGRLVWSIFIVPPRLSLPSEDDRRTAYFDAVPG